MPDELLRRASVVAAPSVFTPPVTPDRVLVGDLRTGRITTVVPVVAAGWSTELDAAGAVTGVQVAGEVVRRLQLRYGAACAKAFVAVETEGRIWQAGPIWAHAWSRSTQTLTLAAGGLWSLFDHRRVLPVLTAGQRVQTADTTISGTDLGGVARDLVAQALTHTGGDLPIVFPTRMVGSRTETFKGYSLLTVGDQIKQLTQREEAAPDVRFRPRRRASDPRFVEWVMEVGTEAAPDLVQAGDDWIFDDTVPRSPIVDVNVDIDGAALAFRARCTGNGTEVDLLISTADDTTLVSAGYPLLEVEEARSNVIAQSVLDGHARNLLTRTRRPTEAWKLTVRAERAREINEGDYVQVVTRGDAYIPDGTHRCRVIAMSGDLGRNVVLTTAPTQALV